MTKITVSEIRSPKVLDTNEILEIVNAKKHKRLGFFVPVEYGEILEKILEELKKKEKLKKIKKVALAQKKDRIEDIFDGVE
ncbi:hypothetical protein [Caminibacter sp.]